MIISIPGDTFLVVLEEVVCGVVEIVLLDDVLVVDFVVDVVVVDSVIGTEVVVSVAIIKYVNLSDRYYCSCSGDGQNGFA